jgi:excinuclease ABC subunit A
MTVKKQGIIMRCIEIIRARTNNLKGISCRIPHGQLTVITGVSGSGKSSLAFDTLYAEGQRRYVESLSTYARQFIERMQRPDVDMINNIPPAIALEQKNKVKNARSTIGTATEINDYLRLLFAKVGKTICSACGREVKKATPQSATDELMSAADGRRLYVLAPVNVEKLSNLAAIQTEMARAGFTRLFIDGSAKDFGEVPQTHFRGGKTLLVVIDRLAVSPSVRGRLNDSLEMAFRVGKGSVEVRTTEGECYKFYAGFVCSGCGRSFKEPEPHLFSFYSPLGACPTCQGFGRIIGLDLDKVIPNPRLSLNERPIVAWNTPAYSEMYDYMEESTRRYGIPWDLALERLSKRHRDIIIEGRGDFCGVKGFFNWLESKRYKVHVRVMLARFRGYSPCPDCGGARLVPEALNVFVHGRTIADLCAMSIKELRPFFDELGLTKQEAEAAERIVEEIRSRLRYLDDVGLGYLTLDRQTRTLSGGEAQRINLATALGSALTDTLYVLDEPTVGLHPRDTNRLLRILKSLQRNGNAVVVVEHDLDIIRGADRIIDLGPQAGEHGGEVVFEGSLEQLTQCSRSQTAAWLDGAFRKAAPEHYREPRRFLLIKGARHNNLKGIDVRIPLGVFACVTGVSGSGKSTLVQDVLYAGYKRLRGQSTLDVGKHDALLGVEQIDDMILVDQAPIGRSIRSNPVTYIKAYDEIRQLLEKTLDARREGIRARDFSFNVPGGRCEACEGTGLTTVDMHFLADVTVMCDVCDGKRFQDRILGVRYKSKNIVDILNMTINEALSFFSDRPRVISALEPLAHVGLGYLRLGQSTATLSGGEAQRLKLASYLATTGKIGNCLMLFDEPTTGLHPADLQVLISVLKKMIERGYSVLVIEHNLELISHADYIIDLGPEGGEQGGRVVAEGPLPTILACPQSYTGRYLRSRFA